MQTLYTALKVILCVVVLSVLQMTIPPRALCEDDYYEGSEAWNQGRYGDAYTHLLRYRDTMYGRMANVDYMIGTSACRIEELREYGCKVLEWMLNRYALSDQARWLITHDIDRYRDAHPAPEAMTPESVKLMASLVGASARASGKMYFWVGKDDGYNSYPAYHLRDIPPVELRARLIPLGFSDSVVKATKARVKGFTVKAYEHFVFATKSGHADSTLEKMAEHLERYLRFLKNEYGITLPPNYATIYMVPTSEELFKLANTLHGLQVSRSTFGYSYRDDMSVLVMISKDFLIGTIMHELFHLTVRSTFGDIPQWMDEGMAGLYEVAKFRGDTVSGMRNWRGQVLIRLMQMDPHIRHSVHQVLTSNWFAFEQYESNAAHIGKIDEESPTASRMAAMLATARYFTFYLQEKGCLHDIYWDLQKLKPGEQALRPDEATVAIVEKHLGQNIAEIDNSFVAWFNKTEHPH